MVLEHTFEILESVRNFYVEDREIAVLVKNRVIFYSRRDWQEMAELEVGRKADRLVHVPGESMILQTKRDIILCR